MCVCMRRVEFELEVDSLALNVPLQQACGLSHEIVRVNDAPPQHQFALLDSRDVQQVADDVVL